MMIALGADHGGFYLKEEIKKLTELGAESFVFDVRNTSDGSIDYAAKVIDVIVPAISGNIAVAKDKNGETALIAEVFLNSEEVKKLDCDDIEKKLRNDITSVCEPLPKYKKISRIEIRDTEFEKTTSRKIKRHAN